MAIPDNIFTSDTFPYSSYTDINLDWICDALKTQQAEIDQLRDTQIDYDDLIDKPSIEGVTLAGNKNASNLGLTKANIIATTFSSITNYYAGDYVFHNGTLYRFDVDHAAGAWTGSDATVVRLAEEVGDVQSQLDGISVPATSVSGDIIAFENNNTVESVYVDNAGNSSIITVCGKNMFPMYSSDSDSGLTWTVGTDGAISFSGTPSVDVLLRLRNLFIPATGNTLTAAFFNNMSDSRLSFFAVNADNTDNWQVNLTAENTVGTFANIHDIVELRIRIPKNVNWTGLTLKPMLVLGDTAGGFKAYNGQNYSVILVDGEVQETLPFNFGLNTVFANNGAVTVNFAGTSGKVTDYVTEQTDSVRCSFYRFEKSGSASYLYIYYKSGDHYVRWQLHNVPAALTNSNTWQIGRVCGVSALDDFGLVEIVRGGEFELAFKEHGAADYCGGNNHGDENTDSFVLHIDGKNISDMSSLDGNVHPFNRIDAVEIATVNRCNTPAQDILKHQKIWIFEDGKVKVRQTIKFLEALSVDGALVCMFPALRSAFTYGVRKGGVFIEDMTTSSYSPTETESDDMFYEMYGDTVTAKIHAKTDNAQDKSTLWVNPSTDLNKLYYGYYGPTSSVNPTSVSANTIITAESEYDVAYTPV